MTLLKLREIYMQSRLRTYKKKEESDWMKDHLQKPRLILGVFYIIAAFGILFNFLIYFLIWCLDPLPDIFIFDFINFSGRIDPKYLNRIEDINAAKYPHEKTIYYCVAMVSFGAILDVFVSIWYLINDNKHDAKTKFTLLIGGVTMGMMAGWTTCLPFFL